MNRTARFFVGITGASGTAYAIRCMQVLTQLGHEVDFSITAAGFKVLRVENAIRIDSDQPNLAEFVGEQAAKNLRYFHNETIEAPPSSGTFRQGGVIIVPCSMGTLARIAAGFSSNLIERSADVALKEKRPLIIVPRETPLNQIHLRNMYRLARAGATILPAMPGFYHRPKEINHLIDHIVTKILDALGLDHSLIRRWGESL